MSKKCCCSDIFTEHAPLIHKARDVQFQIEYLNGVLPATIIDIEGHNVQCVLESYWSKVGIRVFGEIPGGAKNNGNLVFSTANEFIPGTLEVYLSDLRLNGDPTDPERDYDENVTKDGFIILLDPSKGERLNSPPFQNEPLYVNYSKRITFNTKCGT